MPTCWPFFFGGYDELPKKPSPPGVNQGRRRGVTKSAKPRRKR